MARRRDEKNAVEIGEGRERVLIRSRRAAKQAAKAEKQVARAAKAEAAAATKIGEIAEAQAKEDSERAARAAEPAVLTGATVKRYLAIARIVVPIAAPILYQAVGSVRARLDDARARRLGVAPDELASFSGRGTALYARTHHLAASVRELAARRPDDADVRTFVEDAGRRVSDLEAAVRSAEQMPTPRRRRAHQAVAAELDRLESSLLTLWGLERPAGTTGGSSRALPSSGR